jgi:8-amino-7-oxononanoate synthase
MNKIKTNLVNFAGNDYLGLACDVRLVEAMYRAAQEYGISSTSSRWALGWTDIHQELETQLADFFRVEDATILGAAYLGGPVYFSSMSETHRVVFCDEMVHSNQFLGMRAAGLEIRKFRHLDIEDLKFQIEGYQGPPPIIATDGVYGISGEIAPLREFAGLAQAHGAELFIDDAHGVFALGETGRGTAEYLGLIRNSAVILGSMSKAMGCNGGFLAGKKKLVEKFRHSPAASGSAIPPPPIAAACLKSLEIIKEEPERREAMWQCTRRMKTILSENGIVLVSDQSPIMGMQLKDEFEAARLSAHLLGFGLRIPYFKYASEPRENLLRGAARACYTENDLGRFAAAIQTF